MKAKTLLIAAAALAAGIMTSQAQVYSQNIVGYINVALTNASGYTLVCNQLDTDGTGTNNGINNIIGTQLPSGSKVEAWNGAGFKISTWNGATWSLNTTVISNSMNPGAGFFIYVPSPTNVTLVGNVITGTNTYAIPAGYEVVSASGPVAGGIQTVNGYNPTTGDQVEVWTGNGFKIHTWGGSSWNGGGEPVLSVGQAVFLHAAGNTNWTQVLNVQ